MKFILFREIMTIWSTQNSGLLFTRCLYSFCMRFSKIRTKIYTQTSHPATLQHKKYTALPTISIVTMKKNCPLDSLADKFFLSSCYLSHQFKKVTGFTLINYIQKVRITRARDLLLSTNHPISELHSHVAFKAFLSLTEFSAKLTISLHLQCALAQRQSQVSNQMWSFNICFHLLRLTLLTTCSQFQRYD